MNRQTIADKIRTAGSAVETAAAHLADKIDPPTFGVRIVWDEDYDPHGATAWGEPEDSEYEAETIAKLESGEWIAVGAIAMQRDSHGNVRETDRHASLWGIVTEASDVRAPLGGKNATTVWDLDAELSGYLRTVADELRAEAGLS